MNFRVLGTRVFCEKIEQEPDKIKPGTILILEKEKPQNARYRVLSVGDKVSNVSAGDIVIADQYGINSMQIEDKDHYVMTEDKISAVFQ